jgi:hypothetical protein
MSNKLVTFKTNQTLIGNVVEQSKETITIKEPVQVIVQPSKEGPMMGFVPFLEFSQEFKTGITFNTSDILTINNPVTELENEYSKIFGSGITIASAIPKI